MYAISNEISTNLPVNNFYSKSKNENFKNCDSGYHSDNLIDERREQR